MSRQFVGYLVLAAVLLGLFAPTGGRTQETAATSEKRTVYLVKHGDVKQLAAALEKHFKGVANIQAVPSSNYLLVRADAAVVDEVVQLLSRLDRRPRAVNVELFVVDLAAKAGTDSKGVNEADFSGPAKDVVERVISQVGKGTLSGLKRIRFVVLEDQPMRIEVGESIPSITLASMPGVAERRGGERIAPVHYREIGTRVTAIARMSDEQGVTLELDFEHRQMRAPDVKVESVKMAVNPEWQVDAVKGRVSIPPGQVVVAKDERHIAKEGQTRILILASASLAEPTAVGGK